MSKRGLGSPRCCWVAGPGFEWCSTRGGGDFYKSQYHHKPVSKDCSDATLLSGHWDLYSSASWHWIKTICRGCQCVREHYQSAQGLVDYGARPAPSRILTVDGKGVQEKRGGWLCSLCFLLKGVDCVSESRGMVRFNFYSTTIYILLRLFLWEIWCVQKINTNTNTEAKERKKESLCFLLTDAQTDEQITQRWLKLNPLEATMTMTLKTGDTHSNCLSAPSWETQRKHTRDWGTTTCVVHFLFLQCLRTRLHKSLIFPCTCIMVQLFCGTKIYFYTNFQTIWCYLI